MFAAIALLATAALAYTGWRYEMWRMIGLREIFVETNLGWAMLDSGVAMATAVRFARGKGLVVGTIALGLFVLALAYLVHLGTLWSPFALAYPVILIGLIHGVRGAWSSWRHGPHDPNALTNIFE